MLKSAAIVSCGPSAANLYTADIGYDLIIGARDRPAHVRCDWWVFVDWQVFVEYEPIGRPIAVVPQPTIQSMGNHNPEQWERFQSYPKMYVESGDQPILQNKRRWFSWSGTAALGLAWKLAKAQGLESGAQLHLYGYDLIGAVDAAGKVDENNRSLRRWSAERELTAELIESCEDVGWEVIRFE